MLHKGFSTRARVDLDLCKKALRFLEAAAEHREDNDGAVICGSGNQYLQQTKKTLREKQNRKI